MAGQIKPGTTVGGRYIVQRLIGKGGMSTVYEARHLQIGKRVAIKLLSKQHGEESAAMKRFRREAKIAGTIGHLNICEVFDFGMTHDGIPFIVMEYLDGESLSAILKQEEKLPLQKALDIMMQVLDALDEVHARGIIHRDMKPGNIFIANVKGQGQVVKILDFGISKMAHTAVTASLTETGTALGTPAYMSPEQIKEIKDLDHRSDIYSCGIILYKMLTGTVPFKGNTVPELVLNIMEETVPDIAREAPNLQPVVIRLIRRSIEKDREKRFQSVSEFKDTIGTILAGQTAPALHPYTGPALPKQRFKTGLLIALIAGAALILAAAVVGGAIVYPMLKKNKPASDIHIPIENKIKPITEEPLPEEKKETVTIELRNVPNDVQLIYEGRSHEGNIIEITKGDDPLELTILAPGFKEKKLDIVPSRNRMMEVTLQPLSKKRSGKDKKKKKPEEKKEKTAGNKEKKESDDKIDHDWNYPGI